MNTQVIHPDVRAYLLEYLTSNPSDFILKSHSFENLSSQELAQQLIGLQKSRTKFPSLFENDQVLFPPKVNLEQTSSAITAHYKSQLIKGETAIDLTGGYGVDSYAFAKAEFKTTHIEKQPQLQEYALQLFKAFQVPVESHCADGIKFLESKDTKYDLIYLDPSRKTAKSSKAVLLEDYEPNIILHLDLLLEKGNQVMIKTSPMLDITAGLRQLKNVSTIHVVAVKNEVKELLWILEKETKSTTITCVNLDTDQESFTYELDQIHEPNFVQLGAYLYEPNASLMKAQAFHEISAHYGIGKLDLATHLYSSDRLIIFPGRRFKVISSHEYKPKLIKRLYGKGNYGVVARNFRESVSQLRKKFQLGEDENKYLFFTTIDGKAMVVETEKLTT